MGNCESCLDLLELKFLQNKYTKIPEKDHHNHIQHLHYQQENPSTMNGKLGEGGPRYSTLTPLEMTSTSSLDMILHDPNFEKIREKCAKSKFSNGYTLGPILGNGAFSEVKFGTSVVSGENFAIKIIDVKQHTQGFNLERINTEIEILQSIHHSSIIRLYNVFCEFPRLFLILELVSGGELFDRIVSKEYFSENCARDIIKEALSILCYLHGDARVVHRDLKPENFIMTSENHDDYHMKLVDFGFASRIEDLKENEVSMGTPVYVAPEIIRGNPYGSEVDIWSFGVICYIILCGCPPFLDDDLSCLLDKISIGTLSFEEEHWTEVSIEAIDFCRKMLCVDQCDRWTARQLLNHKWMTLSSDNCRRHLSNSISKLKINSIKLKNMAHGTEIRPRRQSISTESPTKFDHFNNKNKSNKMKGTNNQTGAAANKGESPRNRAVTILF